MTDTMQIETYLASLRSHLGSLTIDDREEIVREIGAHIRDSAEESGMSVETVLERLGPAEELAAQYRDGLLIQRASRSVSPVLLLRGALRLATKGVFGIVVLFAGIFGYALGGGLASSGFAKCVFPAHTGTWVSQGRLINSGTQFPVPPPPAHEILGWWYLPIALTAGSLLLLFTTFVIRKSLGASRQIQGKL